MIGAAKRKSISPPGLTALWTILLLVVTLCLGQTRVWGFEITPQPASGVFAPANPLSIGENYDGWQYDASDSLLAAKAAGAGEKLFWGTWNDYPKVTQGGRSYAQVGDRLYTHHAVDRMQTSGLGAPAGAGSPGRSISPNFIEDVIQTGNQRAVTVDGVPRQVFTSGSVEVVTEQGGRIVITVNPFKN